eukprot:TRINITY_DN80530_c0_g1_i1.p1 TRINITY_DN80530_c0_g1~~TRINITY_DN80530_c0_g1_i1.p1  ORF type:complete len:327 (-),score=95.55 TRINITY_DN80530_c0_g1_i1:52-1032(-)
MELIQQGRGWLQDGEGPDAVLEETASQIKATSDKTEQTAWKLVAAEAYLERGAAAEALENASEALAHFKHIGSRDCEAAAASIVADIHLFNQDGPAAAAAASAGADACQRARDSKGEAAMLLKLATANLIAMEDPHSAANAAISSCLLFRSVGDSTGEVAALEAVARAHLLYDPESALKAAKEASAVCDANSNFKAKASIAPIIAAAKAQIATEQHADQAHSFSCRGDKGVKHKWPVVLQQRGMRAPDLFAVEETLQKRANDLSVSETRPSTGNIDKGTTTKAPVTYMRKSFKWTLGQHATDEAWYRQELVYLPPKMEDTEAAAAA